MPEIPVWIVLLGSYLLGAVPFGLLVGFAWKRVDIRSYGSGNIGASNVLRLLGWPAALLVLLLDCSKGFIPVWMALAATDANPALVVLSGLLAIVGHNFSVFLGFRGGKGVATSLGVLIGISPQIATIAFFIWLLVVVTTRYISVASITAAVSVPVMMYVSSHQQVEYLNRPTPEEYLYFGLFGAGFVLLKHRSNLIRLANGSEPRIGQRVKLEGVVKLPKTSGGESEERQ